jgi:hypothetical protein
VTAVTGVLFTTLHFLDNALGEAGRPRCRRHDPMSTPILARMYLEGRVQRAQAMLAFFSLQAYDDS